MNNDSDDTSKIDGLTPVSRRIITSAAEIAGESPPLIEYQHGLLCQIALPRSKPAGREFVREFRNGSIQVMAGSLWNGAGWVPQPLPYGPKARLVLIHLNSEAVKTRCPEICCESSGRKFMERLGLNTDGGSS
jgi:hypothetical protein